MQKRRFCVWVCCDKVWGYKFHATSYDMTRPNTKINSITETNENSMKININAILFLDMIYEMKHFL